VLTVFAVNTLKLAIQMNTLTRPVFSAHLPQTSDAELQLEEICPKL
jgi:hypothetical protein